MNVSPAQVSWFRLRRSGLVEPFATAEAAARGLVGIQAQLFPAAALSLWNRTTHLTFDAVRSGVFDERSLIKLWGQRQTLHLFQRDDWPVIYAAFKERETWWERKYAQKGGNPAAFDQTVRAVADQMRDGRMLGHADVAELELALDEWLYASWGGLFMSLVRRGLVCHGPPDGGAARFVHREAWVPDLSWQPPTTEAANLALTRRYLAAYGPATVQDVGYWLGASVKNARRWVQTLADEIAEVEVAGTVRMALLEDLPALTETPPARRAWPIRLLYRFDPLLLALKDKTWVVPAEHYKRIWRPAGHVEGVLWIRDQAKGTWRYDRTAKGLKITLSPFGPLSKTVRKALEKQALGIAQFFNTSLLAVKEA